MSDIDFKTISRDSNILNRLRVYNPVFTLSAVQPSTLGSFDPNTGGIDLDQLQQDVDNVAYMIAKSSGKGSASSDQADMVAGQYDFYFDNLEISTIPAFNEKTNFSKSTNLNFTLTEPFSVGGLFQALVATSYNAGYDTFQSATYALRVQFIGYADDDDETPVDIGKYGTRYFPIKITGIDVKADSAGTVYEVKAVPCNEMAFADSNRLTANINSEGDTVGDILTDFFTKINNTVKDQYLKKVGKTEDDWKHDTYEIRFPKVDDTGVVVSAGSNGNDTNDFFTSKFVYDTTKKDHESNTVKPSDTEMVSPNGVLVRPGTVVKQAAVNGGRSFKPPTTIVTKPSVQFSATANISDCISAILRDCALVRERLSQIPSGGGLDKDNMFEYFYVSIQSFPSPNSQYDTVNGIGVNHHVYSVYPYKVHLSRLPEYQSKEIAYSDFTKRVRRTYNYLYTGKNTEVLSFNLKYNNLFFQTQSINQGYNKNLSNLKGATTLEAESDVNKDKSYIDPVANKKTNQFRPIHMRTLYKSANVEVVGENTGPLPSDPWSVSAKNVHQALLEEVNMLNVDIDIMGDPYYLIQGGIGNIVSNADPENLGITDTGDADHQTADIYIQINVNSIIDVGKDTGLALDNTSAEFSGLYRIVEIINHFQSGVFTQKLKVLRINSEPSDVLVDKAASDEINALIKRDAANIQNTPTQQGQ
jgi:hypothetical protein